MRNNWYLLLLFELMDISNKLRKSTSIEELSHLHYRLITTKEEIVKRRLIILIPRTIRLNRKLNKELRYVT